MKTVPLFALLIVATELMISNGSHAETPPPPTEWNSLLEQVIQADSMPQPNQATRRSPLSASALWAATQAGSRNLGLRLRYLVEDGDGVSLEILVGATRETSVRRSAQTYRLGFTSEAEIVSWKNLIRILSSADIGVEHSSGWIDSDGEFQALRPISYVGALGISLRAPLSIRLSPFARLAHEWYFKKDWERRAVSAEIGVCF